MRKKTVCWLAVLAIGLTALLSGCGEKGPPLVRVGFQGTKDTIEFDESKVVEDPHSVKEFKTLIAGAKPEADKSKTEETAIDQPYIAIIDNRDGITRTLWLNLWPQRDGSIVFKKRQGGDSRYFLLDRKAGARVTQMLSLKR